MTPTRFERVTPRLGIWCSILLSYGAGRLRRARFSYSGSAALRKLGNAAAGEAEEVVRGEPEHRDRRAGGRLKVRKLLKIAVDQNDGLSRVPERRNA